MRFKNWLQGVAGICWALAQAGAASGWVSAAPAAPGLVRTVSFGTANDLTVTDNVWLFVPAGEPATPFVPIGAFKSTWTGSLVADLRADFNFHVEANGPFKLSVNEVVVLESDGKSAEPVSSKAVRLNKGANRLVAEFAGPASGDAFVRLFWSNKETPYNPIPNAQLQHAESPELAASLLVHEGRDLFVEFRCAKCHSVSGAMPELAMDAPAFTGIGSRRRFDWLAQWIDDPARLRPGAHMPKLFQGEGAKDKADAVAAYLASLTAPAAPAPVAGDIEAGKALYEKFHCVACHVPPDGGDAEPGKISQKLVRSKFSPGALVGFLQNPAEHYAWIRMPNFRLNPDEASSLAAYLESAGDAPSERQAPTDAAVVQRGKELVESVGCLQCHSASPSKPFTSKALADLGADAWTRGCLAETPGADSKSPVFAFTADQRTALKAFAASDRSSLSRSTDADFLDRHSRLCNAANAMASLRAFPPGTCSRGNSSRNGPPGSLAARNRGNRAPGSNRGCPPLPPMPIISGGACRPSPDYRRRRRPILPRQTRRTWPKSGKSWPVPTEGLLASAATGLVILRLPRCSRRPESIWPTVEDGCRSPISSAGYGHPYPSILPRRCPSTLMMRERVRWPMFWRATGPRPLGPFGNTCDSERRCPSRSEVFLQLPS